MLSLFAWLERQGTRSVLDARVTRARPSATPQACGDSSDFSDLDSDETWQRSCSWAVMRNSMPTRRALLVSPVRPMRTVSVALLGCAATLLAASCANHHAHDDTDLGTATQAIGGIEGTFEYALDAPWRMNPRMVPADRTPNGGLVRVFDAVPIQISIHDADRTGDEHGSPNTTIYNTESTAAAYGQAGIQRRPSLLADVCSLTIVDGAHETEVPIAEFDEIERSYAWTFPSSAAGPARDVCSRSSKGNCTSLAGVGDTSEWYGLVNYRPLHAGNTAEDVRLELRLKVKRPGSSTCTSPFASQFVKLVNQVKIHYGEAPLPRFSSQWVYGDLHYHSQGTDNEGESGHNYRGVTRAMGAIGLDYLWATEHASNSEQIMDVDGQFGSTGPDNLSIYAQRGVLRDMDRNRFAAMHQAVTQAYVASAARGDVRTARRRFFLAVKSMSFPRFLATTWVPIGMCPTAPNGFSTSMCSAADGRTTLVAAATLALGVPRAVAMLIDLTNIRATRTTSTSKRLLPLERVGLRVGWSATLKVSTSFSMPVTTWCTCRSRWSPTHLWQA